MQDPQYVKKAFSRIADRYVVTNHVLSLGTDILWRKKVGH
ncbi:MAG: class I SAM-dependent methyltransferase, partial [Deltaproteobacteria bacterium]